MLLFDGMSDIGLERDRQEDVIYQYTYDADTRLFIICDGSGGLVEQIDPAEIACTEISSFLKRQFEYDKGLFIEHIEHYLTEAFISANRVLGTFRVVNEEKFSGFGCSVTACLIYGNRLSFAHCGNTRLHLIKLNKNNRLTINQLTVDHTAGYEKLLKHQITEEQYLKGLDKMQLTSGLGVFSEPEIQVSTNKFQEGNIIIMTTDGIHYPLYQNSLLELAVRADNTQSTCKALIEAAKMQKYPDNMSAMVIFSVSDDPIVTEK